MLSCVLHVETLLWVAMFHVVLRVTMLLCLPVVVLPLMQPIIVTAEALLYTHSATM